MNVNSITVYGILICIVWDKKLKIYFIFKMLKVKLFEIKLKQNFVWDSQTVDNLSKNLALNLLPNTLKFEPQKLKEANIEFMI